MSEEFTRAELLTTESLIDELHRRAKIEIVLLENLGVAVDNRTYDVFLFIFKYGPATQRQVADVFGRKTTGRCIARLEAAGVIWQHEFRYSVQRRPNT